MQQACKLLDDICFWNNETQPDAVCVNLLADAICDPAAYATHSQLSLIFSVLALQVLIIRAHA